MPLPSDHSTAPVEHVMHPGVIDCPPQTPLREVAALMASRRVHCVVVDGLARTGNGGEELVWGIVSDVDLMRAAGDGRLDEEARTVAATEIVAIDADAPVEQAAAVMGEHDCSHLLVTTPAGTPLGVVSSLDVAAALAKPLP